MGKKVNVYLDSKTLKLWGDIPSGQRSSIIKEAIRNNSIKKPVDPKTEMINMKLVKLEKVNMEMEQLIKQKLMLEDELNNLKSGEEILNISKDDFWNKIEKRGFTYLENKSVYHSYSGKSRYSIFDISEGKIFIKNIRTGRTNSNFSKRTTDIAIDRLIAHGGKVLVGQFIPVKMHEFTVVADSTSFRLQTLSGGSTSFSVTNISVKEITDDTNIPRIDYTDGCGVWLLEPQSTNLLPYSEDFSQWTTVGFNSLH